MFNDGANEGFWRFQIRDKYGRWIQMGGAVTFTTDHPNFGRISGTGLFEGGSRPDYAMIRVKNHASLEDGVYEVAAGDMEAVKAIIPENAPGLIEAKKLDAADGVSANPVAKSPTEAVSNKELTDKERQALMWFTDDGYAAASNKLRRKKDISEDDQASLDTVLDLIESSKATEDRVIYRGIAARAGEDNRYKHLEVGDVFIDPGIGSASPKQKVAETFANFYEYDPDIKARVVFVINVPKGKSAFDIPEDAHTYSRSEPETLLPPETSIKVTGIEERDGIKYITGDIVETPIEASQNKDLTGFTKIGAQKGSNPGGLYQDPATGEKFYVKFEDAIRVDNEVLASKLYEKTGINAIKVEKGSMDGKTISYSKWEDGATADLLAKLDNDPDMVQKLKEGFAVDAWLANWDVVGLEYDNLIFDADGNDLRVDPGGALLYRAQGARKGDAFGDTVGELETFQEGGKTTSRIYGNMTQLDRVMSARRLLDVSEADIDEMVDATISDAEDSELLKTRLKNRRSYILTTYGLDGKAPAKPSEEVATSDEWISADGLEAKGESSVLDSNLTGELISYEGLEQPVSAMDAEMFTRDQRVAIKGYTGTDYSYINKLLRTGEASDTLRVHLEKEVVDLDSAMEENGILESPARVFRGLIGHAPGTSGFNGTDWAEIMKNLEVGDVFSDEGYMSTSNDPSVAHDLFGPGSGATGSISTKYSPSNEQNMSSNASVFFSIDLPAGTKALGIPDEFSTSNREKEVLLARGTQLRVKGIRRVRQDRDDIEAYNYYVDAEAIPQDQVGVIDVVDKTAEQRKNEAN
jgi:hypothetical protein